MIKYINAVAALVVIFLLRPFPLLSDAQENSREISIDKIEVEAGKAKILKRYSGLSGNTIFYISDFHAHPEAQKKMAVLIEEWVKKYNIHLILVEGGSGDVNLSELRQVANPKARLTVAEKFLGEGLITGEEYLQLTTDMDLDLEGIEDERLYAQNIQAYLSLRGVKEVFSPYLDRISSAVQSLKKVVYPKSLLDFQTLQDQYMTQVISFDSYADVLKKLCDVHQIHLSSYPELMKALGLLNEAFDQKILNDEYLKFVRDVLERIQQQNVSEKEKKHLQAAAVKALAKGLNSRLWEVAGSSGVPLKNYAQLERFVNHSQALQSMDDLALKRDLDHLERELARKLCLSQDARDLLNVEEGIYLTRMMLDAALLPEEFRQVFAAPEDFQPTLWMTTLERLSRRYVVAGARIPEETALTCGMLVELGHYYQSAKVREKIFEENIHKMMESKKENTAIVITGGFHAPYLTNQFQKRDVSFVSVRPTVTDTGVDVNEIYEHAVQWKVGSSSASNDIHPENGILGMLRPPAAAQSRAPGGENEIGVLRRALEKAALDTRSEGDSKREELKKEVQELNLRLIEFLKQGGTYQSMVNDTRSRIAQIEKMTDPQERRLAAVDLREESILFDVYKMIQKVKKFYGDALIDTQRVMGLVYSPCVGYLSKLIKFDPEFYEEFVISYADSQSPENDIWFISDGSALLGYGNMGVKPMGTVLEGKQSLLRHLGGVNANLLLVDTAELWERLGEVTEAKDIADIHRQIIDRIKSAMHEVKKKNPQAVFMMEDIAAPVCFDIEKEINAEGIPTIHDDQHGTAIVTTAAVINSLRIAGYDVDGTGEPGKKDLKDAKIVCYGAGASAFAVSRLIKSLGVGTIIAFDSKGPLHSGRKDYAGFTVEKKELAGYNTQTDWPQDTDEALKQALKGADGFIGLSSMRDKDRMRFYGREREFLKDMAEKAFVFPMANPIPEFQDETILDDPELNQKIFAVATGRFGGKGQTINNSSSFPGLYHALEVLAKTGRLDSRNFDVLKVTRLAAFGLANAVTDEQRANHIIVPPTFVDGAYNAKVTQTIGEAVFTGVLGEVPQELQNGAIEKKLSSIAADFKKSVPLEIRDFFALIEFDSKTADEIESRQILGLGIGGERDRVLGILKEVANPKHQDLELVDLRSADWPSPPMGFVLKKIQEVSDYYRDRGEENAARDIERVAIKTIVLKNESVDSLSEPLTFFAEGDLMWQAGATGLLEDEKGPTLYLPFGLLYQAALKAQTTGNLEPLALMLRYEAGNAHMKWAAAHPEEQGSVRPRRNASLLEEEAQTIRENLRIIYGINLVNAPSLENILKRQIAQDELYADMDHAA